MAVIDTFLLFYPCGELLCIGKLLMVLINTKMIMISGDVGWMEGLLGEGGGEPEELCDMFQHMYNCGYLYFYY
jgi:hypothetical protein